jgi:predicted GIY-YIG superfamily endonuclease
MGFFYVYILRSDAGGEHFYTGLTEDLKARLAKHNAGEVSHTSKYRPWRLQSARKLNSRPRAYTEDQLVEQPAIGLFAELGWQTVSAMEETRRARARGVPREPDALQTANPGPVLVQSAAHAPPHSLASSATPD